MTTKVEQPKPLIWETPYKTVTIETLSGIKTVQGIKVLDGGHIKEDGKTVLLYVKIDDKPELAAMIETWRAEWDAYKTYKAAEFAANVPGLDELRAAQDAAYNDEHRYQRSFDRMMEDEYNDGANPPAPINETLRERANALAAQYPRAAMYLRAEGYTRASNFRKSAAGDEAKKLIAEGGSVEDAENILKHWASETANWD